MVFKQQPRRPSSRLVVRDGEFPEVVRLGDPHSQWRDLYHLLLTIPWTGFIGLLGMIYLLINTAFAIAYLAGGDCIANSDGSFMDAFFFSVQTMASIGYGNMNPTTTYANLLVVVEAFVGLLFVAMATGLIFNRFSLPTARILFSHVAVIAPHNGVPTLMFRTANKRRNRILEAQLWVTLVRDEISLEGEYLRRFHDLHLIRSHTPLFALTWTAMHPIDPSSPLHGETSESLVTSNAEIVVALTGIDETVSQTIHARHSFVSEEIRWNHRLADILLWTEDGRRAIDYTSFDRVVPIPSPEETNGSLSRDRHRM
ncbi:MAG: ATP-sensitive inward rectifier potassium channel 10 [Leptolyngbyaceae cyanobacterium SM1_1_3]|nr:ATP-sensitive inward rectifier potassium channel 10 [Leptolyngbyaceae cyanobacterium SM1_1_3]NJN03423.1 ATP-sensitive inward rectifier potassium channel 10 [Leptolyngbyaceae cyanobacterium RM1_1_2]NJO08813.1 ATP-sensitive inward rectifier potassium channel 10 [Leptolyngbyaceae cyanobacterium SL_1_1]